MPHAAWGSSRVGQHASPSGGKQRACQCAMLAAPRYQLTATIVSHVSLKRAHASKPINLTPAAERNHPAILPAEPLNPNIKTYCCCRALRCLACLPHLRTLAGLVA